MSPLGAEMRPRSRVQEQLKTVFLVGPTPRGRWLVQETSGLLEGLFISQRAALKFAMDECRAHPNSIVISSSTLTSRLERH